MMGRFMIWSCCVLVGLLFTFMSNVEAIKCYTCTSQDCSDVSNAKQSEDTCKACGKVVLETGGNSVVTRSCSLTEENVGCTSTEVAGISTETCYCNAELCNSSSRIGAFTMSNLAAYVFVLVAKKFM